MAKSTKPRKPKERIQIVYSAPRKIFTHFTISAKGKSLLDKLEGDDSEDAKKLKAIIIRKFRRNHYRLNREAKPIKIIIHKV